MMKRFVMIGVAAGAASLMGRTFANGWTLDYLAVFWIGVAALSVAFTIAAGRCGRNRCGGKG